MKRLFPILCLVAFSARAQELTLSEAIARALEKNADIVVERESVHIADANVLRANAAYEPSFRGDARLRKRTDPVNSVLSGAPAGELAPTVRNLQTSASFVQLLPTGAMVSLFSAVSRDETNSIFALLTPSWSTSLGAEVRQPLLQNRRIDPARRAMRIARVDRTRALSTLRRTASEVTAAVERAYWTVVAARRDVEIRESVVSLAEKQREDTKVRVEAGTQAEADVAQTTAEVERRRGDAMVARENLTRAENALRNLIARDAEDPIWEQALALSEREPPLTLSLSPPSGERGPALETSRAIAVALQNRPELQELSSRLERQDVEIDAALDRVRPQVDLVASYSGRGLAGTRNPDAFEPFGPIVVGDDIRGGLGQSLLTIGQNEFPDAALGVSVVIPIGNTAAKQDVVIARALRRQSSATLDAARQRVALEVRNAIATLASTEQRIEAAQAARVAAEVQMQAERDRFEAGTTNMYFILTRQNDLAAAQLAETVAVTDQRKAETELARAMGTILEERGIEMER
ncbi:MAG: TolC family protein [Acidobacteriota bacterium]|nr:TolC family protein [Acidobacteriota bacterium]